MESWRELPRVYESARKDGREPGDWYAYLRRAMINEYLRNRRLQSGAEIVTDAVPERAAAGQQQDQVVDRVQLWVALEATSARQRAVLVLRYYEGLADRDIAALLRCRQPTVRSLASRGLAAMRQPAQLRVADESAGGAA